MFTASANGSTAAVDTAALADTVLLVTAELYQEASPFGMPAL
jgi:hypothetical protein